MQMRNIYLILYKRAAGITVGDELVFDGGMASFEVIEKIGNDLRCKCTDPGLLLPRAKLSFWRDGKLVEKNSELPTISTKVVFECCLLHFVLYLACVCYTLVSLKSFVMDS